MKPYRFNHSKTGMFLLAIISLFGITSCKKSNSDNPASLKSTPKFSDKSFSAYVPGSLANGLIAYWPMDNSANDMSGNGNNGTLNNVTSVADRFGNANSAYHFNGTSSYISVPDAPSLRLNGTDFTLTAWVKLDGYWNTNGNSDILCKRVPGMANGGWGMSIGSNNVFYGPGGGSTNAMASTTINTGTWYMATSVYSSATQQLSIYVNGTLVNTTSGILSPNSAISALLYIGSDDQVPGNSGYFFDGSMDDVRIYGRAISSTEVQQLYAITAAPSTGLIAYWPMNNTANDLSGNAHNGTLNVVSGITDRYGNYLGAYYFNGTSSYISVPDASTLRLSGTDFTLNAWVKLNSYWNTTGNSDILCKRVPGMANGGWGMSIGSNNVFYGPGGGSTNAQGTTTINTGQWYMVTSIYTNATQQLSLYVDGMLINTTTGVLTPNSAISALLYIGSDDQVAGNSGYFFNGSMNSIRIYGRAISSTDISNLYNALN